MRLALEDVLEVVDSHDLLMIQFDRNVYPAI
jgi:hypothetical protein